VPETVGDDAAAFTVLAAIALQGGDWCSRHWAKRVECGLGVIRLFPVQRWRARRMVFRCCRFGRCHEAHDRVRARRRRPLVG
jgi:hypothetical protein